MPSPHKQLIQALDIEKIRRALQTVGEGELNLCVLLLSGSFNPIHRDHLRILDRTRGHVESLGIRVLTGFLAPSTDSYVARKSPEYSLRFKKRMDLCRHATAEELPWACVCCESESRSIDACRQVKLEIESGCADILNGRAVATIDVMGADTVRRVFRRMLGDRDDIDRYEHTICYVQRPWTPLRREVVDPEDSIEDSAALLGIRLIPVPDSDSPYGGVSSRAIRTMIADGNWSELQATGWLSPSVLADLDKG